MLQSSNAAILANRQRARALRQADRDQAARLERTIASAPAAPKATITTGAIKFVGCHR